MIQGKSQCSAGQCMPFTMLSPRKFLQIFVMNPVTASDTLQLTLPAGLHCRMKYSFQCTSLSIAHTLSQDEFTIDCYRHRITVTVVSLPSGCLEKFDLQEPQHGAERNTHTG